MIHYIDRNAFVDRTSKVWHFAVILDGVVIEANCSIGSLCEIGRNSRIAYRTRIGHGVFLPSNSRIGHDCFIGPGVVFTDDRYPKANNPEYLAEPPIVEDYASIGAGAVILPGVRIGAGAQIGAGAIVTRDVPPGTHVRCEPARMKTINQKQHHERH